MTNGERFFQGGDTNRPANAQITLRPDGGFLTRSNGLVRAYSRVDPHDWDGDGLDNAIDPQPTVSGGDCFGTGAAWLNAQCGNFRPGVACQCQEYNATHPERWLSLSAPAVLMLDGGVGTLAAGYAPYEPAGGVVTLRCKFRARCEGSPWTEANVVLPLAGAGIDTVFQQDFDVLQTVMSNLNVNVSKWERQYFTFGLKWFYSDAAMDYPGRVDNTAHPTVWRYNQVNDESGFGAVATWHGIPVRMAKLGNFMAGYGTELLGVWRISQSISQFLGTGNDATATASWNAGVAVAQGGDVALVTAQMVTNTWNVADQKERNLWPNASQADNHTRALLFDFNLNLSSPRVIEEGRNP